MTEAMAPPGASFLATRKGQLTLAFLCLVAFLDFMGFAIMTVALPTIQRDLHFSQQNLQWVISGYTVTYGGFLLLGGRLADLLGRRVTLVIGTAVFAVTSVLGGAAPNAGTLVGARLAQGIGAALMTPAALSILTTSFNVGTDRVKALGAWGAMGGFSGVLGVFLGGVISAGPGWRWVLYINVPICAAVIIAAYLLVSGEAPRRSGLASFDTPGALLGTGGMLLLIYALVKAPDNGWGSAQAIGELAGAAVLLAALVINELRHPNPVLPLSIFRVKGLAATDAAQVLGLAGLNSAFFFISLYMQEVLHFSALRAGAAYVPIAAIVMAGSIGGSGLVPRLGTRPLIIAGAVIATGGLYWVSRIPVHGYYWTDIFPPLMIAGLGLGLVFVAVQIAGNAGVPPDKAGLAGALITASFQVGVALGLAILSALATARTHSLLSAHRAVPDALVGGYTRALLAATFFTGAVVLIGLRAANTKGEPPGGTPAEITGVEVNGTAQFPGRRDEETTLPGGTAERASGSGLFGNRYELHEPTACSAEETADRLPATETASVRSRLCQAVPSLTPALPTAAVQALRAWAGSQAGERVTAGDRWQGTGLVFTSHLGAALDAANVRKMFKRICTGAAIGNDWTPPELRTSFVSLLHTPATDPR